MEVQISGWCKDGTLLDCLMLLKQQLLQWAVVLLWGSQADNYRSTTAASAGDKNTLSGILG